MFQFDFNFNFITFIGKKNNIFLLCSFLLFFSTLNVTYCYLIILSDIGYILRNVPREAYSTDTLQYKELFALMCEKNSSTGLCDIKNFETHFHFLPNHTNNLAVDLLNKRMFASAFRVKSSYK